MAFPGSLRAAVQKPVAAIRGRFAAARTSSAGFVTVGVAVICSLVAAALVVGEPVVGDAIDLLSGRGWLTRSDTGTVMRANGSSARIEVLFDIEGAAGHDLEVIQVGDETLLVDRTTGEVRSLDMAELEVGDARALGDASGLDLVAAGDKLVVVHRAEGTVEVQDPLTGEVIADADVGSSLTRAVIDDDDQIWVADTEAGVAVPLRLAGRSFVVGKQVRVGRGEGMTLALVGGLPVAVNATEKAWVRIDGDRARDPVRLPLEDGESTQVSRVTEGGLASLAVNESGDLIMVEGDRSRRIELGRAGHELGEPVVFDERIFVPDYSVGELLVLDRRGRPAGAGIRLGGAEPGRFSVRVEGGRLWVDDPDSDDAFVLGPNDTSFRRVDKGNRDAPSTNDRPPVLTPPPPVTPPQAPPPAAPPGNSPGGQPTGPGQQSGTGPAPPPANPTAPGAPSAVTATAGDELVSLNWGPAAPNGAVVTGYELTWQPVGGAGGGEAGTRTVGGTELQTTVDGLRNGATYTFTIRATNRIGTGPAATSNRVTPDGNVPDPPEGVEGTGGGDGTITVAWDAADANGTSPVRSYTVTATDDAGGSVTAAEAVTDTTVTVDQASGLALGGNYTFTVTALNARGNTSAPSEPSGAVTLADVAAAPTGPAVQQLDGQLVVTWTEPPLNGGTLDHYEVIGDNGAGTQSVATSPATFAGLQNGTTYNFEIRAITQANGQQMTGNAATVAGTPGRAPEPFNMQVSAAGTTVNWSVQFNDHQSGAANCTVFSNGAPIWAGPCQSPMTGSFGGAYATTYTMHAEATNTYGTGRSNDAAARTADPPPPPPQPRITLVRGGAAPAGYWYSVTLSGFAPGSQVTVTCRDSVDPQGFWNQTFTINGAGNAGDSTLCYSADGPDHWVTGGGQESEHVAW